MNVLTVEASEPFFLRDDQGQAVEVVPQGQGQVPGSVSAQIDISAGGTFTLTPEQAAASMLRFFGAPLAADATIVVPNVPGLVWDCSFNDVALSGHTITFECGSAAQPAVVPASVNFGCRVGVDYPNFCCFFGLF